MDSSLLIRKKASVIKMIFDYYLTVPVWVRLRRCFSPRIIIQSPDLKLYLAMDIKFPQLPPHYKMERALMVQESTHIS